MASPTPPNVKIYDRPERKGPSPLLLVIALIILAVIVFFIYKALHPAHPASAGGRVSWVMPSERSAEPRLACASSVPPVMSAAMAPGFGSHDKLPRRVAGLQSGAYYFTRTKEIHHENHRRLI